VTKVLFRFSVVRFAVVGADARAAAGKLVDQSIVVRPARDHFEEPDDRFPEAGGALFQIEEGKLVRFRCRVGHAWSPESLLEQQTLSLESALWMAIRSLEEKVALATDLGERAHERGFEHTASRFSESAHDTRAAAELVRRLVNSLGVGETALTHREEQASDGR